MTFSEHIRICRSLRILLNAEKKTFLIKKKHLRQDVIPVPPKVPNKSCKRNSQRFRLLDHRLGFYFSETVHSTSIKANVVNMKISSQI